MMAKTGTFLYDHRLFAVLLVMCFSCLAWTSGKNTRPIATHEEFSSETQSSEAIPLNPIAYTKNIYWDVTTISLTTLATVSSLCVPVFVGAFLRYRHLLKNADSFAEFVADPSPWHMDYDTPAPPTRLLRSVNLWYNVMGFAGILGLASLASGAAVAGVNALANGFGMSLLATRVSTEDPPANFTMIFSSDSQFPWGKNDNTTLPEDEFDRLGIETNRYQALAMNTLKDAHERLGNPVGVVMNGDLTAFGHPWQWRLFKRLYIKGSEDAMPEIIKWDVFPGLGNHDYANDVDDCWGPWESFFTWKKEWCARNSLNYIEDFADKNAKKITNFDPDSRAYSWDMNQFHFVQLHFHPLYTHDGIGVKSSLPWLREDLIQAAIKNQKVILNFHDLGEHFVPTEEFLSILDLAEVIAIFTGHIHHRVGLKGHVSSAHQKIPHFRCGSSTYNTFLGVNFHSTFLEVFAIEAVTGRPHVTQYTRVDYETEKI